MRVGDVVKGVLRNPHHQKLGRCPLCGHLTLFLCLNPSTVRNNMYCMYCLSSSRNRHIAKSLLEEKGDGCGSLASLAKRGCLAIYNANSGDAISRVLGGSPNYQSSTFTPGVELGHRYDERKSCQSLEALTFADASFDVVITEDVFEHIRHHEKAFAEVARVLRPGGSHIFTIPFQFDRKTVRRVEVRGAEDVYLLEPRYHGDKIRGEILVYTDFGIDLFERLEGYGFSTRLLRSTYLDQRYGIYDSYVFISQKRVE